MSPSLDLNQLLEEQRVEKPSEDLRHRYGLRRALLNSQANKTGFNFRQIIYWLSGGAVGISFAVGMPFFFLSLAGEEAASTLEPVLVEAGPITDFSTVAEEGNIPIDTRDFYYQPAVNINLVNAP